MKTDEQLLSDVGSPFQKTFEPDGDNLYLEINVLSLMRLNAIKLLSQYRDYLLESKNINDDRTDEELYEIYNNRITEEV